MIGSKPIALDTNIAVHVLNDLKPVIAWLGQFDRILLPAVVLGELYYGARNGARVDANIQQLQALASRCEIVDVSAAVAEVYGRVRLELKRAGTPIPENDLWIAATCLAKNISLATRDAHFSAVAGLRTETIILP